MKAVSKSPGDKGLWAGLEEGLEGAARFATPMDVAQFLDPRTIETPAIRLVMEAMEWAVTTPNARLIVIKPPQEGKTTCLASGVIPWVLYHDQDRRVVNVSYSESKAEETGARVKNALKAMGVELAADKSSKTDWAIAGARGGMYSAGIASGIAGRAMDLGIIDDPVATAEDAASEAQREKKKEWYRTDFSSRFSAETSVILIQTRWHEDDLAGYLMREYPDEWRVLHIPAQCVDPATDPLGRELGEFMESTRGRTTEDWERRKQEMGTRAWQALCQGDPSPLSGSLVDSSWLKRWGPGDRGLWEDGLWLMSWDLAFGGGAGSDFTVGQVWVRDRAGRYYLVDQVRGQWSFPVALEVFRDLVEKYPKATRRLVEAKANGQALIDTIRRGAPGQPGISGVIPIVPRDSKEARLNAVAPLMEAGEVFLPPGAVGDVVVDELVRFPHGKHDDALDALTQALLVFTGSARRKKRRGSR